MKKFTHEILCCLIFLSHSVNAQNVWTQHNDQSRTGWYPYETTLNTSNVNTNTFGLYFQHSVDDRVFAQPLVMMNVNIPGIGIKNVVYVATMNNTIYAYDADVVANVYWQKNYTNKISPSGPDCSNCRAALPIDMHPSLCGGSYSDFKTQIGIVGTPVIDTTAGTMYFVTKIVNLNDGFLDNTGTLSSPYQEYKYTSTCFHNYLHAVDITTGAERSNSPVDITASTPGTGDGQTSIGVITFDSRRQLNRAGLVLANGKVYVSFAAHCDFNPSHGWVISYNASNLTFVNSFCATPNDGRGGIWMAGVAPAVDASGNLYVATGNALVEDNASSSHSNYNSSPVITANRGESIVKLAPDLTISSYFTPFHYKFLNDADLDFPAQVLLLPNTGLAVTACKDDSLYVMNQSNLGGFNSTNNNNVVQRVFVQTGASQHATLAYYGGSTGAYAYQFSENTTLKAYPVSTSGLGPAISNTSILGPTGYSGAYLSTSSNGSDPSTGIIWTYYARNGCSGNCCDCHGLLRAFRADDVTHELWNSDMNALDNITTYNKLSCPTIALGKVYIASNQNMLSVYGLKTNTSCLTNVALNKTVTQTFVGGFGGSLANLVDGDFLSSFDVGDKDAISFYVDMGSTYDFCKVAITWKNNAHAKDFDLQVSDDHITWTTVASYRGNTLDFNEYNGSFTGRYVQFVGLHAVTVPPGYSISEFQVFGNPASPCRPPANLKATTTSNSTAHISWDAVAGVSQYIIQYHHYLSNSSLTRTVTTNSIDLGALSCGPLYYYTVQADCGAAQSAVSQGSFALTGCPVTSCDLFPVRYFNLDLGDIGVAGSTCKNGNIWTLAGSGNDIGGTSDQFQFAYTQNGIADLDVSGQLTVQDNTNASKLGIMIRDSSTNTSRFIMLAHVNSGNKINLEYRAVPAGPTTTIPVMGTFPLPYFMKISKLGTKYTPYISPDGLTWTKVGGPYDLGFGTDPTNAPYYGMAISSLNNNSLSTGSINNFSLVSSGVLPIRLESFSAESVNNDHVLVSWSTSIEHLVDHFEIQKSVDNSSFQNFALVAAVGESETLKSYSAIDKNPTGGLNFYRLKEVDKDGNFYYSPVVSVKFNQPEGLEIYPNPAGNYTNIISSKGPIQELSVFDVTGKLLRNETLTSGQTRYQLNTSGFSPGVYIITVKTAIVMYRQKLFKQ